MRDILRVDLSRGVLERTPAPANLTLLGGRALISALAEKEIDPECHPLGVSNVLILAPGLLSGTAAPTAGRLSVGGKSPLTGGIKEANAGGNAAQYLARMGLKAVTFQGRFPEKEGLILVLGRDRAELEPAAGLWGLGNYALAEKLLGRFGPQACVISCGPAGEMGLSGASVAVTDREGHPTRHAARGGLGAVMGRKGLKAVVLDGAGLNPLTGARAEEFKEAVAAYAKKLGGGERHQFMRTYGTAGFTAISSARSGLPTRAYTQGSYEEEKLRNIDGARFKELIETRGGATGHACMNGCAVRCSNVFMGPDGKYLTAGFEYETIALLGANLDLDDLDTIAALDRLCDDIGLDTIEMGGALAVLSETGLFSLGDRQRALELVKEIGRGTPLGRIIGQGAATVAKVFGIDRVPAVKGQALPGHNGRALKGLGVTYATSPMGADHTAGFTLERAGSPEGQADHSRQAQIRAMISDSLGLCNFADMASSHQIMAGLVSALTGREVKPEDIPAAAWEALLRERRFNRAAGLGPADDRLPEFMRTETLPPVDTVFDVTDQELDRVFGE